LLECAITYGRYVVNSLLVLTPGAGSIAKVPECLSKLERLVNDSLLLFIISDFSVTLFGAGSYRICARIEAVRTASDVDLSSKQVCT